MPQVLPSLLLCDFAHLASEIEAVEAAGAGGLHLDVMDGHFVPNLTYGLTLVEAIRKVTSLPLDVHLMISNPESFVGHYVDAGADIITVHIEAVPQPQAVLEQIRRLGVAAGLALNPPTPLASIENYLDLCDLVLVMSVMPGFGGQQFDPAALNKLRSLQAHGGDFVLEVDGGVNEKTIQKCAAAGAQWFVAGSAIFGHEDYQQRVTTLTRLAKHG